MKRFPIIALCVMLLSFISFPVIKAEAANYAEDKYASVDDGSITFDKVLSLPQDATVPKAGFSYVVTPGKKINATAGKAAVLAGIGTPTIEEVTYTANEAKDATTDSEATGSSCSKKGIEVDFSGIKFDEPGIYRYVITEKKASGYDNYGITNDANDVRILDVYVDDEQGTLKVKGAVFYKTDSSSVDSFAAPGSGTDPSTANAGVKSSKFVNSYGSNNLTISKTVTGNQGSLDKYFAIKVTLTGDVSDDSIYELEGNYEKVPTKNNATIYDIDDMKTANGVDSLTGALLKAGYTFYLQNGQNVTIKGITAGAGYKIEESEEDYTPSTVVQGDTKNATADDIKTGDTNTVTDALLEDNADVFYTNEREGVIPTGVVLHAAPYIAVGIILLAGIIFFIIYLNNKSKEEEE